MRVICSIKMAIMQGLANLICNFVGRFFMLFLNLDKQHIPKFPKLEKLVL
jgi:hypothetical protein